MSAENNEMKSKMEMVGVGGTTAKQHDGGGYSNDSDHHDEHGLTPYPDPGRHVVSDGTFITGTDTVDKVSKRFLPCKSSSLFVDENEAEAEALTPQDNSLTPGDEYLDNEYKYKKNDIENNRDSKELQPLRLSNITQSQSEGVSPKIHSASSCTLLYPAVPSSWPCLYSHFKLQSLVFCFTI